LRAVLSVPQNAYAFCYVAVSQTQPYTEAPAPMVVALLVLEPDREVLSVHLQSQVCPLISLPLRLCTSLRRRCQRPMPVDIHLAVRQTLLMFVRAR
jgi:hypothetical protein